MSVRCVLWVMIGKQWSPTVAINSTGQGLIWIVVPWMTWGAECNNNNNDKIMVVVSVECWLQKWKRHLFDWTVRHQFFASLTLQIVVWNFCKIYRVHLFPFGTCFSLSYICNPIKAQYFVNRHCFFTVYTGYMMHHLTSLLYIIRGKNIAKIVTDILHFGSLQLRGGVEVV